MEPGMTPMHQGSAKRYKLNDEALLTNSASLMFQLPEKRIQCLIQDLVEDFDGIFLNDFSKEELMRIVYSLTGVKANQNISNLRQTTFQAFNSMMVNAQARYKASVNPTRYSQIVNTLSTANNNREVILDVSDRLGFDMAWMEKPKKVPKAKAKILPMEALRAPMEAPQAAPSPMAAPQGAPSPMAAPQGAHNPAPQEAPEPQFSALDDLVADIKPGSFPTDLITEESVSTCASSDSTTGVVIGEAPVSISHALQEKIAANKAKALARKRQRELMTPVTENVVIATVPTPATVPVPGPLPVSSLPVSSSPVPVPAPVPGPLPVSSLPV